MAPTTSGGWIAERRVLITIAAVLGSLLVLGTFLDEAIAKALYSPRNLVFTIITTIGIYPFAASIVLFLGVACERIGHGTKTKAAKAVLGAVMALAAVFVGFVGAASLVEIDCLGSIAPSLTSNYLVITVLSLVVEWPLFYVGWRLATRSDDKLLLKKAVCFVLELLAAFIFMQLTKGIFNRPRYRVVAEGLEGVGFVPWYKISPKPLELMSMHGLDRTEFRSFPSGHALMSISTISILLSLTWLIPSLRDKRIQLCWTGFAFAVVIMLTRMLLGAHGPAQQPHGGGHCLRGHSVPAPIATGDERESA
ncbi:MAG: phosphatase PAP2 family protein [Coriobacteriales bacterium]|nr:phosphatase PAP2 family protein [Coriobacteriales bacterium]